MKIIIKVNIGIWCNFIISHDFIHKPTKKILKSKNYTHAEKILHWKRHYQCSLPKFLRCSVHSSVVSSVVSSVFSSVAFRKILTWRSQILNITMIRHIHVKLYHLKPQMLKHVDIIKFSDKPTYDTSLEISWLGDHGFWISPWVSLLLSKWRSQYYNRETMWWRVRRRSSIELSNKTSDRWCEWNDWAGKWAKRTSERGYCRIISVARAIASVTGIIRNILYFLHLLPISSNPFRFAFELNFLNVFIWRPFVSPEKPLWVRPTRALLDLPVEERPTDLIASSTLRKTNLSIEDKFASGILVSPVATTFSIPLLTLSEILISSVFKSCWEALSVFGWFAIWDLAFSCPFLTTLVV